MIWGVIMKRGLVATVIFLLMVFLLGGLQVSANSGPVIESTTARLIPEDSIDRVILVSIDGMNSYLSYLGLSRSNDSPISVV